MFGFLNPGRHDTEYRRVYARCCQHQNLNYGLLSLPFLSYESIFLYLCAADAATSGLCALPNQVCCRLRTSQKLRDAPDGEIGRFCSALSLILAATKLQDDIRDGKSLRARLYNWLLKKRVMSAKRYLAAIDSKFDERINNFIQRHLAIEKAGESAELPEYTQPTAEAFGYVFGLMAGIAGVSVASETLAEIGRRVGAALIAFDCASDWERDRAKGEFNPLADGAAVRSAIGYCRDQLREAAEVCRGAFGSECQTSKVLLAVQHSILVREGGSIFERVRELAEQWGLVRQRGIVQLNSDCGPAGALACCCLCMAAGACQGNKNEVHVYHHDGRKGCG